MEDWDFNFHVIAWKSSIEFYGKFSIDFHGGFGHQIPWNSTKKFHVNSMETTPSNSMDLQGVPWNSQELNLGIRISSELKKIHYRFWYHCNLLDKFIFNTVKTASVSFKKLLMKST